MTATQNQPFLPISGGGGSQGSTRNVNICDKGLDRVSAMNSFILRWLSKL